MSIEQRLFNLAGEKNQPEAIQQLLDANPRINADVFLEHSASGSATALQIASENGHFENVKCLVDTGVAVEADSKEEDLATDCYGCLVQHSALSLAVGNGHLKIVEFLTENKADINRQIGSDTIIGNFARQMNYSHRCPGNWEDYKSILKYLYDRGALINPKSISLWKQLLYLGAEQNNVELVTKQLDNPNIDEGKKNTHIKIAYDRADNNESKQVLRIIEKYLNEHLSFIDVFRLEYIKDYSSTCLPFFNRKGLADDAPWEDIFKHSNHKWAWRPLFFYGNRTFNVLKDQGILREDGKLTAESNANAEIVEAYKAANPASR